MGNMGQKQTFSRLLFVHWSNILKKIQQKCCFGPIDSSIEVGPAFPIAICRENGDAIHDFTAISRPAYSVPLFSGGSKKGEGHKLETTLTRGRGVGEPRGVPKIKLGRGLTCGPTSDSPTVPLSGHNTETNTLSRRGQARGQCPPNKALLLAAQCTHLCSFSPPCTLCQRLWCTRD